MSLIYNPNPDIPPYHSMDMNPMPVMDFPSDGNFKPSISYQPSLPQMDPRITYDPTPPAPTHMNPPMPPVYTPPRKPQYSKVEEIANVDTKINWMGLFKKLIIYMILFILMSTMRVNNVLCSLVPYFEQNEFLCMTVKSMIFGIIIIILQMIV